MLVELHGVHKVYRMGQVEVHALREFDLRVERGEFVAVMGPSGSGKSTLLNILGCLDVPTSGTYRLEGDRVDHMNTEQLARSRNEKLGFVFQNFNLLHSSTALENVELPLIYQGLTARRRRKQVLDALARVRLEDRMHHMPWQLSGGQQQRVALARALVNDPSLLLADEPTGNLDTHTSIEIMGTLEELYRSDGMTVVVVTHDEEVARLARRIVILKDGFKVYDRPSPTAGGPEVPSPRSLPTPENGEHE